MKHFVLLTSLLFSSLCYGGGSRDFEKDESDSVNVGTITDPTTAITISMWLNRESIVENAGIFCKEFGPGNPWLSYCVKVQSGGQLTMNVSFGTSGTLEWCRTNPLVNGKWIHFIGTWQSGGNVDCYVDGVENEEADTGTATGTIGYGAFDTFIGRNQLDIAFFDGLISDVHLHTRRLSASEREEVRWKPGSVTNGLIGYWPLREPGTNPQIADLSGNGNHGTNSGSSESFSGPPVTFLGGPL